MKMKYGGKHVCAVNKSKNIRGCHKFAFVTAPLFWEIGLRYVPLSVADATALPEGEPFD